MIGMKNKRGDLAIVVLVFLIVTVCGVSLYSFASTNSDIKLKILDVNYAEGVYLKADSFEFSMESSVRDTFLVTYEEFLKNEEYSYINSGSKINDVYYFDSLHFNLRERFKELFLEKLEGGYDVELEFEGDLFSVTLKNLEFSSENGGFLVSYITDVSYKYNFINQNLVGFNSLDLARKECGILEDVKKIEECFNNKLNVLVGVEEEGDYFRVDISGLGTSGDIEFSFLID